ncbi:hypothetical protein [Reticulibacter mediterranei]|uniref:hypothetical protein n=1 Tax=Reticulibacter mediterranei TaxID=2778369 RepID=UPI001C694173|nr:hypothetical protein [Reticulibacter mediterranei]
MMFSFLTLYLIPIREASNRQPGPGLSNSPILRECRGLPPSAGVRGIPQKPFFFSFARRLRRRAKEGRKLGTPQTPAGRPCTPLSGELESPAARSDFSAPVVVRQ